MENLQYFIKIHVELKREENFVNINIKLNQLHCIYNNETLTGFLLLNLLLLFLLLLLLSLFVFFFKETSGTVKKISRENYIIAAFILYYF